MRMCKSKYGGVCFRYPKMSVLKGFAHCLQEFLFLNVWKQMKSFIAKRVISILVNLRYLRFKLLKYKENNKNICNTFYHNFKNIPLYIMSNVSLERYYFVLYDGALTLKMSKMALHAFCDKTLQIQWCLFALFKIFVLKASLSFWKSLVLYFVNLIMLSPMEDCDSHAWLSMDITFGRPWSTQTMAYGVTLTVPNLGNPIDVLHINW